MNGGIVMPLVQIKLIEGVFSETQKKEMIKKITDVMISIEGENLRQATTVIIEEVKSGNWGMGGKAMTTTDVKAIQGGK
jgi:4-oxalocrotonate tautomerase